jgi:acyl carrier protein phosphodiesterase
MQELKDLPNNEMSELIRSSINRIMMSCQSRQRKICSKCRNSRHEHQSQISKNLSKLKQSLQNMQNMMQQQNQMKAFADMVKILDDLITLSKEQEKTRDNTRQNWKNSSSSENALNRAV